MIVSRHHRAWAKFQQIPIWLFFLALLSTAFYVNHLTPLWADDLCRAGTNGIEPIKKAYNEYLIWSGRFFVTAQTYFFFGNGSYKLILLNTLNTTSFAALIFSVFIVSNLRFPNRASDVVDLLLITAIIASLSSAFFEVTFWKTAVIGYTWTMAGELFVIYVFLARRATGINNRWLRVAFPVFCFYFGTFLEHASLVTSLILVVLLLDRSFRSERHFNIFRTSAIAHVLGTLFLLAAPGNFVRKTHFFNTTPFAEHLLNFVTLYFNLVMDNGWILLMAFCAIIYLTLGDRMAERASINSLGGRTLTFFAASFFAVIVLASVGTLGTRAAFPAEIFLTAALLTMFGSRNRVWAIDLAIAGVAALVISAIFYTIITALHQVNSQATHRDELIAEYKRNDAKLWTLPHYFIDGEGWNSSKHPKWVFLRDITSDPDNWVNQCFTRGTGAENKDTKTVGVSSPVYWSRELPPLSSPPPNGTPASPKIFISNGRINYHFGNSCDTFSNEANNIFLHIYPVKPASIHPDHRKNGFESLDFKLSSSEHRALIVNSNGTYNENACVLHAKLPSYRIDKIVTGVYDPVTGVRSFEESIDGLAR